MQAAAILALLSNISDDVEVYIDYGNYEVPVGSLTYDDEHGILSLHPLEDDSDYREYDDETPTNPLPSSCSIPEAKTHGVKDL